MHHGHLRKKGHHFAFTKSLFKEAIKFNYITVFSLLETFVIGIGIPMGSDPAPLFANFFLAHKDGDWVKAHNVRKINNFFRFIDDLLSLNDDSTFEKHYKDIYLTELE